MNKYILSFVGAAVIFLAIAGGYYYPQIPSPFGAVAPANSTNSTQRQFFINGWNLANGTSTSVLNNTGYDLSATQIQYSCAGVGTSQTAYTGTGLASITLKAATTSTSHVTDTATSNTAVSNTNLVITGTLATSTVNQLVASTTLSMGGTPINEVIPAGSYVTFFTNATNTAVCNIGVQAI